MNKAKMVSVILIAVLVLNLVLFIPRKTNPMVFWGIIIICGLFAWKILPKLK